MRRKIPGGRVAPHPVLPGARPPPSYEPSNKTAGAPRSRSDATQPPDVGTSRSVKAKGPRLKSLVRVSALLSSGSKTSGQPPAIHPPWNKARVRPAQEEERSRNGLEEEAGARERENRIGEAMGRGRTSREVGAWERNAGGGAANNDMRLGGGGGGGVTAEHRAELLGPSSTGHFTSLGSGIIINGSYFQTAAEASQPPAVKQKLSEALSLISLARRPQGPARVGEEQRGSRRSWRSTIEKSSSAMYGSVGDMSISAAVSQRAMEEERRRRHALFRGGNISTQTRGNRLPDSDSESGSGSKESSASAASSSASSVTAERDRSESDRETEEDQSDSDGEEGSADTASETGSQSRSESESEEEEEEFRRKPSKDGASSTSSRKSKSAKVEGDKSRHSSDGTDPEYVGCAGPTVPSCRPQTSTRSRSSHETIEEDSEEEKDVEGEDEEAKSAGSGKSSRGDTSSDRSDAGSGLMDASDDLSPIMEDTEEEEEEEMEERSSGSHSEDGDDAEEEGDLENESAD